MARNKELMVLVVDVGPHMHSCLQEVGQTLFNVVLSKILNKPSHEVAVIFFGATETKNQLHQEFLEQGDSQQFLHVSTAHILQCVDLSYLRTFQNIPRGMGRSDWVDALYVALDVLLRAVDERMLGKSAQRITMISNFLTKPQELDEESRGAVVARLQDSGVVMEFVDMQLPPGENPLKRENLNVIANLLAETAGDIKTVGEGELGTLFKSREIAPFTMYRGPLTIGKDCNIQVRVCKKASRETLPHLKPYSDKSPEPSASHLVMRETEYKLPSNPDAVVPPEERIKAYRYGKQNVPLPKEDEEYLEYRPDKSFQVVGFVPVANVPRYHYTKDPCVVLPDLEDSGSCMAIAALARALHKKNMVCIARPVLRARDSAKLVALTPLLTGSNPFRPDCLIMNTLPFVEDVRSYFFEPLGAYPENEPNDTQRSAVRQLIKNMSLVTESGHEMLKPENTINPALNRFYTVLGTKALDPEAPVPEADGLCDLLLEPPLKKMKGAAEALEEMKKSFTLEVVPMKEKGFKSSANGAAAGGEALVTRFGEDAQGLFGADGEEALEAVVEQISSSSPVDDFRALLLYGKVETAMKEMADMIMELVSSSVGDRNYSKALGCVHAFRTGCMDVERPQDFNTFLQDLCNKFKSDPAHQSFWVRVMAANVSLINSAECESSKVSPEEAKEFVRRHSVQVTAAEESAPAEEEEEDEFAGLE